MILLQTMFLKTSFLPELFHNLHHLSQLTGHKVTQLLGPLDLEHIDNVEHPLHQFQAPFKRPFDSLTNDMCSGLSSFAHEPESSLHLLNFFVFENVRSSSPASSHSSSPLSHISNGLCRNPEDSSSARPSNAWPIAVAQSRQLPKVPTERDAECG